MKRDYNFRKKAKTKEIMKRVFSYNNFVNPSTPIERVNDDGVIYYTEGPQSKRKAYLKKRANKKIRNTKNKTSYYPEGSHYKKVYDLHWIWY